MSLHQSIVWIDAQEARISHMEKELRDESTILALDTHSAPIQTAGIEGPPEASDGFFHQVARALDTADEILIVGPSATKVEFVNYLHKNEHSIDPRILGIEAINYPNDSELAAFAKLYFTVGGPCRAGNGSKFGKAD
jgi:stalled ribosome rescue protein Dom34